MANRVWIYQADRFLTDAEVETLQAFMSDFITQWKAHGVSLDSDFEINNNLFLIIKVNEARQEATGCSIDASVHAVKEIQGKLGINFFNRQRIAYQDSDGLKECSMAEFKSLAKEGTVSADTPVFNNTVTTIEDFESSWKTVAAKSWHKMLLN